jgi:hypothetical protein
MPSFLDAARMLRPLKFMNVCGFMSNTSVRPILTVAVSAE